MDVYPIEHKGLFLNIITDYDLSFKELRLLLDRLMEKDVFGPDGDEPEDGCFYNIVIDEWKYIVDVQGYEVIIYRKIIEKEKP